MKIKTLQFIVFTGVLMLIVDKISYKWVLIGLFAYYSLKVVQWYRTKSKMQKSGFYRAYL